MGNSCGKESNKWNKIKNVCLTIGGVFIIIVGFLLTGHIGEDKSEQQK